MNQLSQELALRIALASRVLPDVGIPKLITVLHEKLGNPLNDEKLKAITVTNLKTGIGSLDGEEDGEDIGIGLENIKLAVRYLWGEEEADEGDPRHRDSGNEGRALTAPRKEWRCLSMGAVLKLHSSRALRCSTLGIRANDAGSGAS